MSEPPFPSESMTSRSTRLPLSDCTAVITGSSSGIGRATALKLADAGARVLLHGCRNEQGLHESLELVGGRTQGHEETLADLSTDEGRKTLVALAWEWTPRIDIWINFAGADVLTGQTKDLEFADKLDLLWRTDVMGTIETSRAVVERMKAQAKAVCRPSILNMGWDQAEVGMSGDAGEMFGPIKAAVLAFTRSLARSAAPEVRVNAVAPGWIQTAWGNEAPPYWDQRARRESLSDRWGTSEDVAAAAAYLVSPAADFVTGHVLPVNGGFRHEFDPPNST